MIRLRAKHWGGYLALLAMVMQLAFSFGHIHGTQLHDSHAGSQLHVDARLVSAAKSLFDQIAPSPGTHDHQDCKHRNDNDHNDRENQSNEICLTLAAAGSQVLPVNTAVPWHFKSVDSHQVVQNTTFAFRNFFHSYQTRAPPFAPIV